MIHKSTLATINIENLVLDINNPRFAELYSGSEKEEELIEYLLYNESAKDVAKGISFVNEFYPDRPLWVIKEGENYKVKDGNRRCAAVKALNNPKAFDLDLPKFHITELPVLIYNNIEDLQERIIQEHTNSLFREWDRISKALETFKLFMNGNSVGSMKEIDTDPPQLIKLASFYYEAVKVGGEDLKKLLRRGKGKTGGKTIIFERLFRDNTKCGYKFHSKPSYRINILNQEKFESYIKSLVKYLQLDPKIRTEDIDNDKDFISKLIPLGFLHDHIPSRNTSYNLFPEGINVPLLSLETTTPIFSTSIPTQIIDTGIQTAPTPIQTISIDSNLQAVASTPTNISDIPLQAADTPIQTVVTPVINTPLPTLNGLIQSEGNTPAPVINALNNPVETTIINVNGSPDNNLIIEDLTVNTTTNNTEVNNSESSVNSLYGIIPRKSIKDKPAYKRKKIPAPLEKLIKECYSLDSAINPNAKTALSRVTFECTLKFIVESTLYQPTKVIAESQYFRNVFYDARGLKKPFTDFTKLKNIFSELILNTGDRKAFEAFDLEIAHQIIHNYKVAAIPANADGLCDNLIALLEFMLEEEAQLLKSIDLTKL